MTLRMPKQENLTADFLVFNSVCPRPPLLTRTRFPNNCNHALSSLRYNVLSRLSLSLPCFYLSFITRSQNVASGVAYKGGILDDGIIVMRHQEPVAGGEKSTFAHALFLRPYAYVFTVAFLLMLRATPRLGGRLLIIPLMNLSVLLRYPLAQH